MRHCVVTDVIWEDYGRYTVRWLWYFLLLHTRCSIFWHVVTMVPEELLSCPAGYTSDPLLAAAWRSGRGSVCLDSHLSVLLRYTRKAWSEAPPCSPALLYTQADPASVMAGGGAAHWHLPNSRGTPASLTAHPRPLWRQTGRLNWAESRLWWTAWETRPHISKTKWKRLELNTCHKVSSRFNIHQVSLSQRKTVGLDS